MFKFILSVALSTLVSVAVAETGQLQGSTKKAQNMPVIVKSEQVEPGLCRIHFEDGASKDISCPRKY